MNYKIKNLNYYNQILKLINWVNSLQMCCEKKKRFSWIRQNLKINFKKLTLTKNSKNSNLNNKLSNAMNLNKLMKKWFRRQKSLEKQLSKIWPNLILRKRKKRLKMLKNCYRSKPKLTIWLFKCRPKNVKLAHLS